jgi:hypothetical protein
LSDSTDDDLPQRWKENRPKCTNCLRDIAICGCAAVFGLVSVRGGELPPDQAVGKSMTFALSSGATTSTSATYVLDFGPLLHNEITGDEIAMVAPTIGRAASVRQHVEEPRKTSAAMLNEAADAVRSAPGSRS